MSFIQNNVTDKIDGVVWGCFYVHLCKLASYTSFKANQPAWITQQVWLFTLFLRNLMLVLFIEGSISSDTQRPQLQPLIVKVSKKNQTNIFGGAITAVYLFALILRQQSYKKNKSAYGLLFHSFPDTKSLKNSLWKFIETLAQIFTINKSTRICSAHLIWFLVSITLKLKGVV